MRGLEALRASDAGLDALELFNWLHDVPTVRGRVSRQSCLMTISTLLLMDRLIVFEGCGTERTVSSSAVQPKT
jgi:hypothetical protein